MGLEHRWSARKPVSLEAMIFSRPLGLTRVRILNISLEGVFISAEHLKLPVSGIVELTFALDIGERQNIYQLEAMVIHTACGGYGLMFKDFKLHAFRALKAILSAA